MAQHVTHRPRLAWDGARVVMAAIEHGDHAWLATVAGERLGPEYRRHIEDAWLRLAVDPDRTAAEAGLFRARLDDLLARRPELQADLASMIDEAGRRFS
jgi:hypothetical protein